jgi:hypothetical protein
MSTASYFKTLGQIEDRVTARMVELRQAELDVRPYVGHLNTSGMALDSAAAVYRHALVDGFGVPERELRHLDAANLRVILKHQAKPGAPQRHFEPTMAHDSNTPSPLDSILKGIKPPRDRSTRNDFRR